jgi:hypothetical protein|tara:strand:+ start:42 stop:1109 length:1068 start_codon:yes stop_codon:yes gene_type:complete
MPVRMIGSNQRKRLGQQAREVRVAAEGKERQGPRSKQDTAKKTREQIPAQEPMNPTQRRNEMAARKREFRIKLREYGLLTGGQVKLDKNKNNKIDAEDFAILRRQKAKPMKAALGAIALGVGAAKMLKGKKKSSKMRDMAGIGAKTAAELYKKKMQGMNKGDFVKRRKMLAGKSDGDTSFDAKKRAQDMGIIDKKTGAGRKRFMEAAKSVKLGKRLLIPVALGITAVQALKSKMKKNKEEPKKKMGGGMIKASTGAALGAISAGAGAIGAAALRANKRIADKKAATKRDKSKVKKMGGGLAAATERLKAQGKMGGGMMTRSMGYVAGGMTPRYKAGKSVMAKGCKLGRKKPTKMY